MVTTKLLRPVRFLLAAAAFALGAPAAQAAPPAPAAQATPPEAATTAPAAAAVALGAPAAPGAPPAPQGPGEPRAHHDPVVTARAHEDLRIIVTLDHGEQIRTAGVVYRSPKGPELRIVPLQRGEGPGYLAIIPGEEVQAPGIAYAIEIERLDGRRVPLFASRAELQPVEVMDERMDVRERALLKRLEGRRSVVSATSELVRFGSTRSTHAIPCAAGQTECAQGTMVIPQVDDQYWRVEVGYTYRPLRTVAEFSLRIGVVRGTSLVQLTTYDASRYKVGLNYAEPSVRFRLHDSWHLDLELYTSITEIGFSVGGGGALLIGDPLGTHLTLGGAAVGVTRDTYFGSRFYARYDVQLHRRVRFAPVVEVTDMPHADTFGVRLYGDLDAAVYRGFSLGVRGGYQARRSTSGGVGLGGTAALAF
jgi:hypothetical protein